MRTAKKTVCTLILAALLLLIMSTAVFAAENGSAWLSISQTPEGDTFVSVVANTAVTDGLVELNYDSANLTYTGVEVNEDCVAAYSANADTVGTIKLAWVAPGEYETQSGVVLLTFRFTGVSDSAAALTGKLNDAQGNAVTIRESLNTDALEAAIAAAKALNPYAYTEDSFATIAPVLASAEAVLADAAASQEQVDAAAQALNDAMEALVPEVLNLTELKKAVLAARGLTAENYTEESFAAVEAALAEAEAVLVSTTVRQAAVDAAEKALNDAMDALVLSKTESDSELDTAELEKAILKAIALDRTQYTRESYAAVEAALATAQEMLANATSQEQIDAIAKELNDAIRVLDLGTGVPDTGNVPTGVIAALLAMSAVGIAVAVCLLNNKNKKNGREGRCEK